MEMSHGHLHPGRDSKGSTGVAEFDSGTEGRIQECPDGGCLPWGRCRWMPGIGAHCDRLRVQSWLALVGGKNGKL